MGDIDTTISQYSNQSQVQSRETIIIIIIVASDGSEHDESGANHSDGIWSVRDADNAFHDAALATASLFLEESKGAEGYYYYNPHGSHLRR